VGAGFYVVEKREAPIEIGAVFKIQYPMKNLLRRLQIKAHKCFKQELHIEKNNQGIYVEIFHQILRC
jgi:hypothetical protein